MQHMQQHSSKNSEKCAMAVLGMQSSLMILQEFAIFITLVVQESCFREKNKLWIIGSWLRCSQLGPLVNLIKELEAHWCTFMSR